MKTSKTSGQVKAQTDDSFGALFREAEKHPQFWISKLEMMGDRVRRLERRVKALEHPDDEGEENYASQMADAALGVANSK